MKIHRIYRAPATPVTEAVKKEPKTNTKKKTRDAAVPEVKEAGEKEDKA